jgi:hypothetical protein
MAFNATFDSSLTGIRYVAETTPGTTPATPTMQEIEVTNESLNNSRQTETSQSFRGDRQVPGAVKVSETNGGDIGFEFKYGAEHFGLMESALQGVWASNKIVNGTTRKSYTIEKEFGGSGATGERFQVFKGMEVSAFTLEMAVGAFITGSYTFVGRSFLPGSATLANTVTAASTTPFMNAVDDGIEIAIDGTPITDGILQNFSMTLDNNLREQRAIGSADLAGIGAGRSNLTGSLSVFFNGGSNPIYTAYKTEQPIELKVTVPDTEGNAVEITLFKVILMSATIVAGGLDQDVVMEMEYQAILGDTTPFKTIQIERIPHA